MIDEESKRSKIKLITMKTPSKLIDLSRLIQEKHHRRWVALNQSQNKIVAFGNDVKSVLKKAKQLGEPRPVLTFAVNNYQTLVS